jgi:serine O-acetyltransferase
MHEHLKKRDQVRDITHALIQTFGSLQPRLEHLSTATPLPDKASVIKILDDLLEVIYPGYFGRKYVESSNIEYHVGDLLDSVYARLCQEVYRSIRPACDSTNDACEHCLGVAEDQSLLFLRKLVDLRRRLSEDLQAAFDGDPAAKSLDEVIFAYPAVFAITTYRLAHELYVQGIPLLPRIMSEHAHSVTGIDIHPGAAIGLGFFIDHGTGVVIGETTNIGNHVKLYQGVTLGALSLSTDEEGRMIRGKKRHPTIEDDVVIYSGATILGGSTVIGHGSVIGGNVWLTHSVPPYTRVLISEPELVIDSK